MLAEIERGLERFRFRRFRMLIVGQGSQRGCLEQNVKRAQFTGVLHGEQIGEAYANMDAFAFPSETDTFGNVVLEGLASGVPAVVTAGGGPKFLVQAGVTGFVASGAEGFTNAIVSLMLEGHKQRGMNRAARDYAPGAIMRQRVREGLRAYGEGLRPVPERASIITTDASRTRG